MASKNSVEPNVADSLALALVKASDAPVLLLDEHFCIIAGSTSFCHAYGIEAKGLGGRQLFELGTGEWNVPQLRALLKATASGHAAVPGYEMELKRKDQPPLCVVVKAQKLDFAEAVEVRILMAVADVTATRASEGLMRQLVQEKTVLLQELQHRVANSLQIIASVLLQSARKVTSDESKVHLHDAHHRVMSVAAVQRQLAASQLGDVELRPYFTQLCASIGASMIADHDTLTLEVTADGSIVPADVSVSLGLIVTELVINALKHAFPDNRSGRILVDYHSRGPNWTLTVGDDGVGMPTGSEKAKPGLGTGIVEALAKQLKATVQLADKRPGTTVQVMHIQIAAVANATPTSTEAI
jgi:two-component sensor histidine kinase